MSKIDKENKPITSEKLMNEFHRYQKGSITRRHFLGVTGIGAAMAVLATAIPTTLFPHKAHAFGSRDHRKHGLYVETVWWVSLLQEQP